MISLWWIRRDIRLADNPTLQAAMQRGPVIPVFVLDTRLLAKTPARRQDFLFNCLRALHADLQQRGSGLIPRCVAPSSAACSAKVRKASRSAMIEGSSP